MDLEQPLDRVTHFNLVGRSCHFKRVPGLFGLEPLRLGLEPVGVGLELVRLGSKRRVQAAGKDDAWEKGITEGVKNDAGKVVMQPNKGKISPEDIKGLVKVCRDFKGK